MKRSAVGGASGRCWAVQLLQLLVLLGEMVTEALRQERLVLSHDLSGIAHNRAVDGITVMSEPFYTDTYLYRVATIMPREARERLLVQFVYVDLPPQQPCQDSLQVCEVSRLHDDINQCRHPLLETFCGHMAVKSSIETLHGDKGVSVRWKTTRPQGTYEGFKIIITAFSDQRSCDSEHWHCDNGHCIHGDLRCDSEFHCKDRTDETNNCSITADLFNLSGQFSEGSVSRRGGCTGEMCVSWWSQQWLGLIIPSCLVLLLVLAGLAHKVYIKFLRDGNGLDLELVATRNRHLQRRLRQQQQQQQQQGVRGACHVATQQPELEAIERDVGSTGEELDGALQQEMMVLNPTAGMLLPPPYSPKEPDTDSLCPPTHGEPPPLYEELTPDDCTPLPQPPPLMYSSPKPGPHWCH